MRGNYITCINGWSIWHITSNAIWKAVKEYGKDKYQTVKTDISYDGVVAQVKQYEQCPVT